jgi:hypothetical protein
MKKRNLGFGLSALVVLFTLCSALPMSRTTTEVAPVEKQKVDVLKADASKLASGTMSYSELKQEATKLKGEKLSFKEKLALRLFHKKLAKAAEHGDGKSQLVALLLVILVGTLGIHRFYLGYTWQGIVQLLTLGGCYIWWLIDLVRVITGSLKPKYGDYGTTL